MKALTKVRHVALVVITASIPSYSVSLLGQTTADTVVVLRTIASTWHSPHQTKPNAVLDEFSTPSGPTWIEKKAKDKASQRQLIANAVGSGVSLMEPMKESGDNQYRKDWLGGLKRFGTLFTFIPITIGPDSAVVEVREGAVVKNEQEPSLHFLGTSSYAVTLRRTSSKWVIVSKRMIDSSIGMLDK